MIKAIVLDIGGVLIRTEDRSSRRKLENEFHLPEGYLDDLIFNSLPAKDSTIGNSNIEKIWIEAAERINLPLSKIPEFKQAFWAGDRLDHELLEYLQSLRDKFITAFLTNAWVNARQALMAQYGLQEGKSVDHIIISSEVGNAKPDPEIYHFLASVIDCNFQEILFVDDFIENIETAESLGIKSIHYQPGINLVNKIDSILDSN
jgi:glucose-1-phosphatase